jgi:MFS family permease
MVITHLPSSVFLALLPVPAGLPWTILLLVGRSVLNSMDQAPRSAFLSLIVLPEERTAVMGVVNILKTLAQSAGPSVTGILAGHGRFWVAFVAAGSLKAAYDLMLLAFFGGRVNPRKGGVERVDGEVDGGVEGGDGRNEGALEREDAAQNGSNEAGSGLRSTDRETRS